MITMPYHYSVRVSFYQVTLVEIKIMASGAEVDILITALAIEVVVPMEDILRHMSSYKNESSVEFL